MNLESCKRAGALLKQLYNSVLDFVYPPQCVICDKLHDNRHFFICKHCQSSLDYLLSPLCIRCRNRLDFGELHCQICNPPPVIRRLYALGNYDDFYRPLIHAFKYQGLLPIGKFLADNLAENISKMIGDLSYDYIIPIPLHKSRYNKRGFNQSHLIAEILSSKLGFPLDSEDIIRIKKTKAQVGLRLKERIENLRDAFILDSASELESKAVLLVDDVTTTGATAMEAARLLKLAGSSRIDLAVIAVAGQDSEA